MIGATNHDLQLSINVSISQITTRNSKIARIVGIISAISFIALSIFGAYLLVSIRNSTIFIVSYFISSGGAGTQPVNIVNIIANIILNKFTVQPLEQLKKNIIDDLDLAPNRHIVTLMDKGTTEAKKNFAAGMNFNQLKLVRPLLSDKMFKDFIQNVPTEAHLKWRRITAFKPSDLNNPNGELVKLIKTDLVVRRFIRNDIYKMKNRVEVLKQFNEIFMPSDEFDTIAWQGQIYSIDWLIENCNVIKDLFADHLVSFDDGVVLPDNPEMNYCLEILIGRKDLPSNVAALKSLAVLANQYGIDELLIMIAHALIKKAGCNEKARADLLKWVNKSIPPHEKFNEIREVLSD